jgi:hypothetical protein
MQRTSPCQEQGIAPYSQWRLDAVCFGRMQYASVDPKPHYRSSFLRLFRQPRSCLSGPHAARVSALKMLRNFAQRRVIVSCLIACYSAPIHGGRCGMGIRKSSDHVAIPSFRIAIFLVNKGDTTETGCQSSHEIAVRQIAFQPHSLLALTIEEEHCRRPNRIEAVEPQRMFFDMRFY